MKRQACANSIEPNAKLIRTGSHEEPAPPTELNAIIDHPEIQNLTNFEMIGGNKFNIKNVLGEGMFGIVFHVENEIGEQFAAKVMKQTNEPEEAWQIELNILQRIATEPHENLLHLLSAEEIVNPPTVCTPNVLMTRVLGPSVLDIITNAQQQLGELFQSLTFPIPSIRDVGRQMMEAMCHLERLRVYHLDLKPENVYFYEGDYRLTQIENGVHSIEMTDTKVQIGDFGCSKFYEDHGIEVVPSLVQTQNYRAPEIFMGLPYSHKSDVWSFAAILCEMYTGQLLFYGTENGDTEATQFEMMQRVVTQFPSRRMWRDSVALDSPKIVQKPRLRMRYITKKAEPTILLHQNIRDFDVMAVGLFIMLHDALIFDPNLRPSFDELKQHTFFDN